MEVHTPIDALIRIAAEDEDLDHRLKAVDCLTRLNLAGAGLEQASTAALALLPDLEAAARLDGEAAGILARVPSRALREALGRIARKPGHPAQLTCALALARVGDPGGVECLIEEFRRTRSADLLQAAACLPLEKIDLPVQTFEAEFTDPDPMVRFWAAIAGARLGAFAPIDELWAVLAAESWQNPTFEGHRYFQETPPLFHGNPWTPFQALARGRPVPGALRDRLLHLRDETLAGLARGQTLQSPKLPRDANLLFGGLTGITDVYGEPITEAAATAPGPRPEPASPADPAAEALAQTMLKRPMASARELTEAQRALLGRLSPPTAGRLLRAYLDSLARTIHPANHPRRLFEENELEYFAGLLPAVHLNPLRLVSDARLVGKLSGRIIAWTLKRIGAPRVLAGLAPQALAASGAERREMLDWIQRALTAGPIGGGAGGETEETVVQPLDDAQQAAPSPMDLPEPPPADAAASPPHAAAGEILADAPEPPSMSDLEILARGIRVHKVAAPIPETAWPTPPPTRIAWPHLQAPESVVADAAFDLEVGIGPLRDPKLSGTGAMVLPAKDFELQVELLTDPEAFRIEGERIFTLSATQATPYPKRTVKIVALDGPGLAARRRIGAAFSAEGVLRGYAEREVTVRPFAAAPVPGPSARPAMSPAGIDLTPFTAAEAADLTIVVRRGDDAAGRRLVFTACSPVVRLPADDAPPTADLGDQPDRFAAEIVRKASAESQPLKLFDLLVGKGRLIARKLPESVRAALNLVCAKAAEGERAASVLIVSEDPYVPWELAVVEPGLASPDCESPFLGARVALGRWVLSADRPPPHPTRALAVRDQAVIAGRYEGVVGWKRLQNAEQEADDLARDWPPAQRVAAAFPEVREYLHGRKTAGVLHFALHGKFDAGGLQSGLILIRPRPNQPDILEPDVLEADHVRSGDLSKSAAFVFLNACQVGAGQELLGDYAGLAEAFLFIGATAVVAPLWSIDDGEARKIALDFYRAAYEDRCAPAEILRRARAAFTEAAAGAGTVSPTHLAYQFFGHPRLALNRVPHPQGDDP